MLSAAKEETFSAFGPWCAETCISASECEGEKPHQGVASKNPTLHQGITWSNSTTALGLRGARLETRVRSRCTGKERDSESNLDMFGARYYGSNVGRFMTPDWAAKPIAVPYASFGNPQSLNLYSYVNNNPTTTRDPDGHQDGPCSCGLTPGAAWDAVDFAQHWGSVTWTVLKQDATAISNVIQSIVTTKSDGSPQAVGGNFGIMLADGDLKAAHTEAPKTETKSDAEAESTRAQALGDAKRDAGVPTSQQGKQETVPVTDQNGKQVVVDGKPQTAREYTHTTGSGQKVVIQDHSHGHTFPDGQRIGPHFNVRPLSDKRHGTVPGTKSHYPYK